MEFCDKCGALMLPVQKERSKKPVLRCRECGHERKADKSPQYTVEYRIKHSPREKIVVVEKSHEEDEEVSADEKRERAKEILEFYEEEETE